MERLKLNSTTNSLTTGRNFMYNDNSSKSPVEWMNISQKSPVENNL